MQANKIKTFIFITILILLILNTYLIWVFFFKTSKTPEPTLEEKFAKAPESAIRIPSFKPTIPKINEIFSFPEKPSFEPKEKFEIPILPIPKPDTATLFQETTPPEETIQFFENIQEAVEIVKVKIGQEERKITMPSQITDNPISSVNISTTTSAEIFVSMTDKEFNYLYPETFLASIMDAQNLIKEYDSSYEIISEIKTDAQIRLIEEQIIMALFSAGMITKEETETYITTIRFTLPQLQIIELKYYKSSDLLPQSEGLFFAGLIDIIRNALISKAEAKVCGYCYILPECYQVGASNPAMGINTWAPFCYCTGCYTYLGCLSRCTSQSAIWDPTTGICGCG